MGLRFLAWESSLSHGRRREEGWLRPRGRCASYVAQQTRQRDGRRRSARTRRPCPAPPAIRPPRCSRCSRCRFCSSRRRCVREALDAALRFGRERRTETPTSKNSCEREEEDFRIEDVKAQPTTHLTPLLPDRADERLGVSRAPARVSPSLPNPSSSSCPTRMHGAVPHL